MKPRAAIRGFRRAHLAGAAALALPVAAAVNGCGPGPLDAIAVDPSALASWLIAHYTFDEGAGLTAFDHSGNGHDAILDTGPNQAKWVKGKFGGALSFDGNDFATVMNFPNATPSFSVSAWVRSTDTRPSPVAALQTIVSTEIVDRGGWEVNVVKGPAGTGTDVAYWDHAANAYERYSCSTCLTAGQWTHVVSVVDDVTHTLAVYIDGRLANVMPAPTSISPGMSFLVIGGWIGPGQARFLRGDVDDIAIYRRALASAEVLELEHNPAPDPH